MIIWWAFMSYFIINELQHSQKILEIKKFNIPIFSSDGEATEAENLRLKKNVVSQEGGKGERPSNLS